MTQIELRCWAIEQAIRTGAQDVLAMAREILAFAECVPPFAEGSTLQTGVVGPKRRQGPYGEWTAERIALMTKMRRNGERVPAIRAAVNLLPGLPVTLGATRTQIWKRNLPNVGSGGQLAAMAAARASKRAA